MSLLYLFASKERKLLRYAETGNTRKVQRLLAKGVDVNTPDEDGSTPLGAAVFGNHQETAELLIAAGAEVNIRQWRNDTVLMQAAWNGWLSTVEQLIAAGADVNAASNSGTTALINAAVQGHAEIARCLIAAGADVHARNWERGALCAAIYHHHPEAEQVLRAAGATLNLAEAAECGDKERVQQLLAEGVSPDEGAAITRAAWSDHEDIVRLLLESGAEVNATDTLDNTALHHAVHWGRTDIVRLLLDAGADITIDNINGHETPLILAVLTGRTDCVRLLLEKRDCSNQINKRIEGITTLLHLAVDGGHTEIVRLLLQHGADVHIKRRLFNDTPLELAISNKREEIAALLRAAGASAA